MKKVFILLAIVASLCFGASAPHTHDGFFLSIALGFGYQDIDFVTYDYDDETNNLSGTATDIDVKIGFSATNSLAVHLTLAGDTPLDDMDNDGDSYNANLSLLGLGATYYFPNNFLASASFGVGQFRFYDDISTFHAKVQTSPDDYSRSGLAFQIAGGKEWWVSDNWGIGATASILYGFETNLADTRESSLSFTVRFTATFS